MRCEVRRASYAQEIWLIKDITWWDIRPLLSIKTSSSFIYCYQERERWAPVLSLSSLPPCSQLFTPPVTSWKLSNSQLSVQVVLWSVFTEPGHGQRERGREGHHLTRNIFYLLPWPGWLVLDSPPCPSCDVGEENEQLRPVWSRLSSAWFLLIKYRTIITTTTTTAAFQYGTVWNIYEVRLYL